QGVDVAGVKLSRSLMQRRPVVPGCCDQSSGDAVTLVRRQVDSKVGAHRERGATLLLDLAHALVKFRAYHFGAGIEDLIEQPSIEGSWRNRIDIDTVRFEVDCK